MLNRSLFEVTRKMRESTIAVTAPGYEDTEKQRQEAYSWYREQAIKHGHDPEKVIATGRRAAELCLAIHSLTLK